jgi:hypothetical protein
MLESLYNVRFLLHGVCRGLSHSVLQYLQGLSTSRPGILSSTDVSKSLQPPSSDGATASNSSSSLQDMPTQQLAVVAPQLLALLAKSSVLLVMSLLTELLVADKPLRQGILTNPGKAAGTSWQLTVAV